jgi:DNA helicase-2/ATP-dependent DNA helicase PcrA
MAAGARLAIECPEVGAAERTRFRAVLLDEYQDTSVSQRLMLQGLFSGGPGGPGRGHAVTAVGDPCQGIYGWRGASVDNIDDFAEHFPLADGSPADTFSLLVNRRCAGRILSAANELAGPLYDVHKGAEPLAPRPDAPAGRIHLSLHQTVLDEVARLPGEVARMRAELDRSEVPACWSDLAVLVRNRQSWPSSPGRCAGPASLPRWSDWPGC